MSRSPFEPDAAHRLSEDQVPADPFTLFEAWMRDAHAGSHAYPNAMVLATATPHGVPSCRVVLLKDVNPRGFTFYTNYESRKGRELDANPSAALVFYWEERGRQVRVEGIVERTSTAESEAYFGTRPRESQIGAWASDQSSVLPDRTALEERFAQASDRFGAGPVPHPPHWGGYRVKPEVVEFWQEREHRLHDRLRYRKKANGWSIDRLSP